MNIGDMVIHNKRQNFFGTGVYGIITNTRVVGDPRRVACGADVNYHMVYWGAPGAHVWIMERNLEIVT